MKASAGADSREVQYRVKSIVCYIGDKSTSGHYIALRFEGGRIIVCNDSHVYDKGSYSEGLVEYCQENQNLGGYLYFLEKKCK